MLLTFDRHTPNLFQAFLHRHGSPSLMFAPLFHDSERVVTAVLAVCSHRRLTLGLFGHEAENLLDAAHLHVRRYIYQNDRAEQAGLELAGGYHCGNTTQ